MGQNPNNLQNQTVPQPVSQAQTVYVQQPQPVYVQQPQPVVQPQPVYVQQPQSVVQPQPVYVQQPQPVVQPQPVYVQQPQSVVQPQPVYVQQSQPVVQPQVVYVQVPAAAKPAATAVDQKELSRQRKLQRKADRAPAGLIWLIVLLVMADLGGALAVIISLIINAVLPV